ncbi:hypothetical protein HMN09_00519500 [Mycena chlorophos]|uniref:Uncharacterized protein n=1 Tax=Mycena chlorophos TaxID=658473 RepID=A0A8H6TBE1_MYCCL|nr:hypothetical protein HMN09_00519500 [Mycena chlorophos]
MLFPVLLRRAGPRAAQPLIRAPRRTIFGFGGSKPEVPTPAKSISKEDFAKSTQQAQDFFKDKPDAVNAIVKFAKVLEESGVSVSTGKMPGPTQLMKLAKNPKFFEAYGEVQKELAKAGVDVQSKEFMDMATSLYKGFSSK